MANIAMLGYGTVGSGVVELVCSNKDKFVKGMNVGLKLSKILVRDIEKYSGSKYRAKITDNFDEVMKADVDIVVEAMGGVYPSYDYVKRALESKKHVVTANKDLIAEHGAKLLDIANSNGVELRFEASVGGGIPILKSISDCLVGNNIRSVKAILNGTTNFILSKMNDEGMQYEDALKAAQELGFAEADPSSDVLGLDAARKLSILSTMAFQKKVDWKEINAIGINDIDSDDFRYAKGRGCSIKLLAISKMADESIYASVAPVMVRADSQLGGIHNEYNAVLVEGDAVGDVMFSGKGAGMMPTASAMFGDIADIIQNRKENPMMFDYEPADMQNLWEKESRWLLRVRSGSRIEVMKKLGDAFSNCSILAGEFGAEGDEVAAFVKAKDESQIDRCMDDLKGSIELKGFKKIMVLED
ncbi:MAG: hom1 [Firmicutes bacterium]|nr:hom1 [Bacillota bacterium]